jgi:hypothetical protein
MITFHSSVPILLSNWLRLCRSYTEATNNERGAVLALGKSALGNAKSALGIGKTDLGFAVRKVGIASRKEGKAKSEDVITTTQAAGVGCGNDFDFGADKNSHAVINRFDEKRVSDCCRGGRECSKMRNCFLSGQPLPLQFLKQL